MGSSNPLSVTPPRRYQGTSDLLVEDVQKDDEWLYSPSTDPSPALSGTADWDMDVPPPNLRTSLDKVERSNSLRGKLGLKPQSSRASSQSVTPQELSPRLTEYSAYGTPLTSTSSDGRFKDRLLDNKQSLHQLRSMFQNDKREVPEGKRRSSAPSAYALKRTSSSIPAPRGHGPPSPGAKSTSSGSPSTSLVERTVSSGSRIPYAPGVRRYNSLTLPGASASSADSGPRRASDGAKHLVANRPQEPKVDRPGFTTMQARVKAGSPGNDSPSQSSGSVKKPAAPAKSPSLRTPGYTRSAQSSGRATASGQVSSPSTPGSVSRLSSAGSFSGKTAQSGSTNLYVTPSSGASSKLYVSPSQTAARSVNQPARPTYTPSSSRSPSMGSSSKAGFNSSVPRTFNFLEETTPKRRGSTLEREEMASLNKDHSPASPQYAFPDEESPRHPVAHVDDQSWAHVRSAVAQAKRSRTSTGSSREASRGDPLRNSTGRSSVERNSTTRSSFEHNNSLRHSGGLGGSQGNQSSSHNGGDNQGGVNTLLSAKRRGSSGNLATTDLKNSLPKSSSTKRAAYFPSPVSYQLEPAQDMLKRSKVVSSDEESWGPGEGSVSGESGPWTGSHASDEEEENGAKLDKKGAGKRRRRFRKSRTRFRGTESGIEGDESEIDLETASHATAGSPLPANLTSLPDNEMLPDTPSGTMSVDPAEGGKELQGARKDGMQLLEPLPDVSIDVEKGVLTMQTGSLGAEPSATAEQRILVSEPRSDTTQFNVAPIGLNNGQTQAKEMKKTDVAESGPRGRSMLAMLAGNMEVTQEPKRAKALAAEDSKVDAGRESLQSERSNLPRSPATFEPSQGLSRQEAALSPRTVLTLDEYPAVAKGLLALEPAAVPGIVGEGGGRREQGFNLQKSPSERLVVETAVEQVGMLREGQLPDEVPPDDVPPTKESHTKMDQQSKKVAPPGDAIIPQKEASKETPAEATPLEKVKPPVLSFDDIPVRGVQGMYSERPPMHSPPSVSPGAATPLDKKKSVMQADSIRPPSDSIQKQQGPKTEAPRRIRSAGGGGPTIPGLRSGSSGANLEKAIASMNRRNSLRRSSDRSTATQSENCEWERSSLADETYSDISTPSTMLSRKTLEEAAESAIFCSSVVHDVMYKAASLAQEKEDLAKLGMASGELAKLVSKQKGPEGDNATSGSGIGRNKHIDRQRPAKKKQPACGCTIL